MHTAIGPLMLMPGGWGNTLLVKTGGGNPENTLSFLKEKWVKLAPYRPFETRFLDDEFQQLYDSEKRTATVFNLFSGIAIVLACMGLFGLSAYSARQRMKEIGIRKVLGATVWQITVLLSRSFLLLVLVASLVALPIAWWMMDKWLQDFAYRTDLQIWMFAGSTLMLGVLTLLTVGIQATKAAVGNPVRALRMD
jgi:putative ABC transport system permease protein